MVESKTLAYSVTLWDEGAHQYRTFLPGDTPPDWALDKITNPKAFKAAEQMPVAGTEDFPIPGPSQLPHNVDARFAGSARYVTGMPEEQVQPMELGRPDMSFVINQPTLHDTVGGQFPTEAAAALAAVRSGRTPSDQDLRNARNLAEDHAMTEKANQMVADQQRQIAEQLLQQQAAANAAGLVQVAAAHGYMEQVQGSQSQPPPVPPAAPAPAVSPEKGSSWTSEKTIDEVLNEVGDDKDKAKSALESERARGDEARSSLVDRLEKKA